MTQLSVALLGRFEARETGDPIRLPSRRTEALFAYLVHTGRTHTREHLAELLWSDDNPTKAAGNLRVLLSNLRNSVGNYVEITRTTAAFRPPDADLVQVDVRTFDAHRSRPMRLAPDELGPPELEALQAALEVCRGEFLESLDLPGSTRFDDWLRHERTTLNDQRAAVLSHLVEAELGAGSTESAMRHALELLELEPLRESAHQLVIRAHIQRGDTAGAVRQFEHLETMQREEFGSVPGRATRSLVSAALGMRASATKDSPAKPVRREPAPRAPWSRFVGRQSELATILGLYAEATQEHGGVVFVRGAAGTGKTVLLRQAARILLERDPDMVVVGGTCSDVTRSGAPGLLLPNLLAQLAGEASGSWLEGRVPAKVAERLDELPALQELRTERGLPDVAEFTVAVRRLARHRTVLLLLDDLHWAAPEIVNLVTELSRDIRQRRLMLVAAVQPEMTAQDTSHGGVSWLMSRVRRLTGAPVLDLDHDDPVRARAFVDALVASERNALPKSFSADLTRHGEGHPLITVELLRQLVRQGQLVADRSGRFTVSGAMTWDPVPERVALLVEEWLAVVPDELWPLLELAAAQGVQFNAAVVAAVSRRDVHEVVSCFSRVLGRDLGLVRPSLIGEAPAPSTHQFRHAVVRQHVLARLDPVERDHLVDVIATVAGQVYGARSGGPAAELRGSEPSDLLAAI